MTFDAISSAGSTTTIEYIAGQAIILASCTAGTLVIRGIAVVTDSSTGTTVNTTGVLSGISIADDILTRDVDNVEVAAPLHTLAVTILKQISRFERDQGAGFARIYQTDGATVKGTQAIVTNAALIPTEELGVTT